MVRRILLIAGLSTLALFVGGGQAGASVTIGQLPSATPVTPGSPCSAPRDLLQPSVTGGTSYVVPPGPGPQVLTSWSHFAASAANQRLTRKLFRGVSPPGTYQVIAHDGPRTMTSGTINTFSANIAVQPGDILGLHAATNLTACLFATPPDSYSEHVSDLADGQSTAFSSLGASDRIN